MAYYNKHQMAAHVSVPTTSFSQVTGVESLACFEIMHIKDTENLWNRWELNRNPMRQVCKPHPFIKSLVIFLSQK